MKGAVTLLTIAAVAIAVHGGATARGTRSGARAANASGGWFLRKADRRDTWLYVAGSAGNVINVFDLTKFGDPQIGHITAGVDLPGGMAVDPQGTLYAPNWNGANVTIYPPMATEPSLTLTQDLTIPAAVAVDTNGDVYVANRGSAPSIVVFPDGQTTPSRVITSDLIESPQQIAFDGARNLYISDNLMGVSELAYGSQQPTALNLQGLKRAEGIAIDPRDGNVFVSDEPSQKVLVYKPGNPQPLRATQVTLACFLTIGSVRGNQYVFVPSCGDDDVWVMATDSRRVRGVLDFAGAGSACCIVIKPPGIP
jgi:hypothetical protein